MATAQNKKWALDTNVVLDLSRELDAALSLREIAFELGYSLHIPPTGIGELVSLSRGADAKTKAIASATLTNLPVFRILPLDLPSGSQFIVDEFSGFLRDCGAIPHQEVNDGAILAEASLGNAALLVSSDSHLASIDPDELRMLFDERGLKPVPVTTPLKLLRIFEKRSRITGRY